MFALPFPAWAGLGGDAASVQSDQIQFQGTLRSTDTGQYTIHEITASTGVLVREYMSPSGSVFAIAFNGPVLPDFKQLLGAYYDRYVQAQHSNQYGHRPLAIQDGDFVLQITGRMRAFRGVAYLPNLAPVGVRAEEIR